jgi:heat shock protein HslJ
MIKLLPLLLWIGAVSAGILAPPVDGHAQARREALQNYSWRLTRLGNTPVADSTAAILQFQDTTYTLAGVCNRVNGSYWTRGISRIGFQLPAGTWRACTGLNLDVQVGNMLKRVNRYRVHTSGNARSLSLRRGWVVLAVLEAK